ncbi:MAG TPA: hypothetical protein ENN46_00190 [Candidatus Woesearchaeota archaeon]|nr:hypothetical protein [Candidatus Woesearchaeota archaeon]
MPAKKPKDNQEKKKRKIRSHHLERSAIFLMISLSVVGAIIFLASLSITSGSTAPTEIQVVQMRQSGIILLLLIVLLANIVQFVVLARIYEQHEEDLAR